MRTFLALLLILCGMAACGPAADSPEKAALDFLEAYYGNDFEQAIRRADDETRTELEETLTILQSEGITAAEMKAQAMPVIIEIEGIIANDGSRAVCSYRIRNSEQDANALTETLMLVHTDEGWKASF